MAEARLWQVAAFPPANPSDEYNSMLTAQSSVAVFATASLRLVLLAPFGLMLHANLWTLTPCAHAQSESQPALHARIDALLMAGDPPLLAARAADGQLLRRLSLDLRGVVPNRQELDAFVADASDTRWQVWVHRFLEDPLCDEHLVNFLDRTLMLRRPHVHVDRNSWLNYLRQHIADNTPLDQLSGQLLNSPWWNEQQRAAQKFYVDRGGDPNLIARDVGRVFLGRDLQCAQCHDHPQVEDYLQADYHGLLAFFAPSKLSEATYKDAEGKEQKIQLYIEQPAGDAAFESVFNKGVPFRSGPRLPGQAEQFIAYLLPDARLSTTPLADALPGAPPPPAQSRRNMLAELLTVRSNRCFVSNWSNRLWALVFGRGLVHPLDMQHADNPPSHPALFELLTDGLVELDMRPRRFIEQLVLSQAYQRGAFPDVVNQVENPPTLAAAAIPALRGQVQSQLDDWSSQLVQLKQQDAVLLAEYETALDAWRELQKTRATMRAELDTAEASMLTQKGKSAEAAAALAAAQKSKSDHEAQLALLADATAKIQQAIAVLSAEDPVLSQAIGMVNQRVQSLNDGLPAAIQAIADAQVPADAALAAFQQATAQVQKLAVDLEPLKQKLSLADAAALAARGKWSDLRSKLTDVERRIDRSQRTLAWVDGQQQLEQLNDQWTQSQQAVASMESESSQNQQLMAAASEQLSAAQAQQQTAAQELAAITQQWTQQMNGSKQIQQAIEALETTFEIVRDPESLRQAQSAMRDELVFRQAVLDELQVGIDTAQQAVAAMDQVVAQRQGNLDGLQAQSTELGQSLALAQATSAQLLGKLEEMQTSIAAGWEQLRQDGVQALDMAGLFALTPEQLCWSTLRITGQLDAHIRAHLTELDKQSPLAADADELAQKVRYQQAVRNAFDQLRGNADIYVSLYASGADKTQDDFFASADQALFTANAGSILCLGGARE